MKVVFFRFFSLLLLLLATSFSPAFAWDAAVLYVSDGDTVVVRRQKTGEKVRVRLYGIDAPEGKGKTWAPQPYSRVAARFLKVLLPEGSRCAVLDMGFDKYQRTVGGVVSLPDGTVVQETLLEAGLAWVYPKYCVDCRQWKEMEREAREAKRGLWKEENPTPPWEWRRGAGNQ